jgi:hypothetical protein
VLRKIIWMMSVSLDGFMERSDRQLDWQLVDDEVHRHFNDWLGALRAASSTGASPGS